MPREMFRCPKCDLSYPRTAEYFVANPLCSDGLEGRCRACRNVRVRDFKRKNSERLAANRRANYAADRGQRIREQERLRLNRNPIRYRAQQMRAGMKERALLFGLPFDRFLFTVTHVEAALRKDPMCECCRSPFQFQFEFAVERKGPRPNSPSIDRIIPRLGYVKGNVAILCWRCNNLKRDATAEELEKIAAWMRKRGCVAHPDGEQAA